MKCANQNALRWFEDVFKLGLEIRARNVLKSLFYLSFCVARSPNEMKFTLELVASAATRNRQKEKFYLLLNMIQFTLSTVLYLSINLFKESLRFAWISLRFRRFFFISPHGQRRSANKYSSLKVFAFLIKEINASERLRLIFGYYSISV